MEVWADEKVWLESGAQQVENGTDNSPDAPPGCYSNDQEALDSIITI